MTATELADRLREVVDLLDAIAAGRDTERTLTDAAAELNELADEAQAL